MLLWMAYGIALSGWAVLAARTAQRYPSIPPRFPVSTDLGGNPTMWAPRAAAWLAPAILAALIVMLGFAFTRAAPKHGGQTVPALVMLVVAEIAPLMIWNLERQIEVARGERPCIPTGESLRAAAPVLGGIVVVVVVAAFAGR